jgi:hypothetical protein
MEKVIAALVGIPLYVSAFLVWPFCRYRWRKQKRPTDRLRSLFFANLICQLILIGFLVFSHGLLQHQYGWCILMLLANGFFTVLSLVAASRDYAASETNESTIERPPNNVP